MIPYLVITKNKGLQQGRLFLKSHQNATWQWTANPLEAEKIPPYFLNESLVRVAGHRGHAVWLVREDHAVVISARLPRDFDFFAGGVKWEKEDVA